MIVYLVLVGIMKMVVYMHHKVMFLMVLLQLMEMGLINLV